MKHVVTEIILKNGAKGLLVHIPQASVMTFEFNFRAGDYLMTRPKWETPHLMEHMLLGANQLIPKARTFQAEFEKNGAYCNASTGSYDIIYESECADFEWDRIFGLLLTAITKPMFLPEEFEAEFGNVREELNARSNNHFRNLSLSLREKYGFSVLKDQERLTLMDNVVLADVRNHYEQTHTSSNLRFVIGGNLPLKRRRIIEKLLDCIELPRGDGRRALPKERPVSLEKPLYIENQTVDNLYFYVDTFMRRRMSEPESDALNLVRVVLSETYYSKILGAAREQGLVYHLSSGSSYLQDSSNWWFGAQIMPQNVSRLLTIMTSELHKVFDGHIDENDLKAAKQYSIGRFQRSAQTVGGTAAGYSDRYFFEDIIDDYYAVPERIEVVKKQTIVDISRALFAEHVWGLGVLGNAGQPFVDDLHQQLSALWSK